MELRTFLILVLWSPCLYFAQSGCTDPQATNYNPSALINDGSCNYPNSNYGLNWVANLSDTLQENSGLIRLGTFLYTFNDSGAGSYLYEMDTNGILIRTLTVQGATNVDWEAISANSSHVFIGDVGNNAGNRIDLCIYRIPIQEMVQDTVQAEKMVFYWEDQTQFASQPNANNYDCEAFFAREDSLVLFSKNWTDLKTRRYSLPVFWSDTLSATCIDSFNVDGLITDACYDASLNEAYLLGYKNNGSNFYTSFIWCLWDFPNHHYFGGNKRRIEIGNVLNVSQTEGITLSANHQGFVSSEKVVSIITLAPKLFRFQFNSYFESLAEIPTPSSDLPFQIITQNGNEWHEIYISGNFSSPSLCDLQGRDLCFLKTANTLKTFHHGIALLTLGTKTTLLYLP